jgi:hypothetical protein
VVIYGLAPADAKERTPRDGTPREHTSYVRVYGPAKTTVKYFMPLAPNATPIPTLV